MPDVVIPGAAAVAAVKKVAEEAAHDIYGKTKSAAGKTIDKLLVQFGTGFSKYITRTYNKCRFVKTILHRIDPIPIESAYVHPTLLVQRKRVSGTQLLADLAEL